MLVDAPSLPQSHDVIIINRVRESSNINTINKSAVSIKRDEALVKASKGSIGEVMEGAPGVHSTFYGPNASRPIVRGLGEARVRLLVNGLEDIDASTISNDHSPAIDALSVSSIDIYKGVGALRYGSNPVGGAINVTSTSFPKTQQTEDVKGEIFAGYGTNGNSQTYAGNASYKLGKFTVSVNLAKRKSDDYKTSGFVQSKYVRDITGDYTRDTVANSWGDIFQGGGAINYYGANSNFGIAYHKTDSKYGIPNDTSKISLKQDSVEIQGDVRTNKLIKTISYSANYGDYTHSEIEDTGELGTKFNSKGYNGRVEATLKNMSGFDGIIGIQGTKKDFDAIGEEAFVKPVTIKKGGAFILERREADLWGLELGARADVADYKGDAGNRNLNGSSLSASIFAKPKKNLKIAYNIGKSDRLPDEVELFANGPHGATSSYEIGDSSLKNETSYSHELSFDLKQEKGRLQANIWKARFDNFINFDPTGAEIEGLPVYKVSQKNADLFGGEIMYNHDLFNKGNYDFSGEASADYVRGKYKDGNIARIPPLTARIGLNANSDKDKYHFEVVHIAKQDKIADNEIPTDKATVLNASYERKLPVNSGDLRLILNADNITNQEVREHSSLLKDYVPRIGRNIKLSLHYKF